MENKTPVKKTKVRAKNLPDNTVGMERHDLYQQAIDHIKIAISQGFYLEAITLIESMIGDRLESHLTNILELEYSFKTLGDLITTTRKNETDEKLRDLVLIELDQWRQLRNNALHGMAKIEEGNTETWEQRVSQLPSIAKKGLALMSKIASRVKSLKKAKARAAKQSRSESDANA